MEETKGSILSHSDAHYLINQEIDSTLLSVSCDLLSLRDPSSNNLPYPTILSISSFNAENQDSKQNVVVGTASMSSAPWKGGHASINVNEAFGQVDWNEGKSGPIEVVSKGFGNCSIPPLKKGLKTWVEYLNSVTALGTKKFEYQREVIVGTQEGTIFMYDETKERGNILKKKREKNVNEIFADIMYEHGDAITCFALKESALASASLDGKLILWRLVPSSVTVFERELDTKVHDSYSLLCADFLNSGALVSGGLSKKLVMHDCKSKASQYGYIRKVASNEETLAVGYDYGVVEIYDERKIAQGEALQVREIDKGASLIFDLKSTQEGFLIGHERGIDVMNQQNGLSFNLLQTTNSVRAVQRLGTNQVLFSCDGFGTLGRATWKFLSQQDAQNLEEKQDQKEEAKADEKEDDDNH